APAPRADDCLLDKGRARLHLWDGGEQVSKSRVGDILLAPVFGLEPRVQLLTVHVSVSDRVAVHVTEPPPKRFQTVLPTVGSAEAGPQPSHAGLFPRHFLARG